MATTTSRDDGHFRPWRSRRGVSRNLQVSLLNHIHSENESHSLPAAGCGGRLRRRLVRARESIWHALLSVVDIGVLSLVAMAMVVFTGLVLRFNVYEDERVNCASSGWSALACYFLSAGLFGFIGGFTNWLAIAMVFTKVPFLYGSGVVPSRYREIRTGLRREIISSIFDSQHFFSYANRHMLTMLSSVDIPQKISTFLATPEVDGILQKKLNQLRNQPEGQLLAAAGIQPDDDATLKPALVSAGADLAPAVVTAMMNIGKTPVQLFRQELDTFITQRVETLDQDTVTNMLKQVLRPYLGWVILWGSFFGMLTGIIVQASGIAPRY